MASATLSTVPASLPASAAAPSSPLSMRGWVRAAVLGAIVVGLASLPADSLVGALAASTFVFGLLASVMAHEAGHALVARWCGMTVTDFWVGMGPVVWGGRRGALRFGLRLLPIGGFVSIPGMAAGDRVEPEHEARTFRAAGCRRQLATILAGPAVNVALAAGALVASALLTPLPEPTATLAQVTPGGAAAVAGLEAGDRIAAVDGAATEGFSAVNARLARRAAGDTVTFTVDRGGRAVHIPVTLAEGDPLAARVVVTERTRTLGEAVGELPGWFGGTISSFAEVLTPAGANPLTGSDDGTGRMVSLVGATRAASDSAEHHGFVAVLELLALVNVFLALFNLLPIPPLDGGQAVLVGINRVGRWARRDPAWEVSGTAVRTVSVVVAACLLAAGVWVLAQDLLNPVTIPGLGG